LIPPICFDGSWRALKYKTFDLNLKAAQDYELIRYFAQSKKAKRVFSAYVRLSKFLSHWLMHSQIPKACS